MKLMFHNTVTHELEVSATVILPVGWQVVSGNTAVDTTIQPDYYFEREFTILAPSMKCAWTVTALIELPEDESGDEITFYQDGGLFPCPESEVWDDTSGSDAVFVGRARLDARDRNDACVWCDDIDELCVLCEPGCGVLPAKPRQGTMTVSGKIDALSTRTDSFLARLQLRVWAGYSPARPGFYPAPVVGSLLAEVRLNDNGAFSICVPYVNAVFLEITATDEVKDCASPWYAQTLWLSNGRPPSGRYFAVSPTYLPISSGCNPWVNVGQQYVDQWSLTEIGMAHFPATMIAYDLVKFMPTSGEEVSVGNAATTVIYPADYEDKCEDEGGACYRSPRSSPAYYPPFTPKETIFLWKKSAWGGDDGEHGDIVDHEFGHRAHDGMRGFVGTSLFQEGIADFWRVMKETHGDAECGDRPTHLSRRTYGDFGKSQYSTDEILPYNVQNNFRYYASWLVDIYDNVNDNLTGWTECQAGTIQDRTSGVFSTMWLSFKHPMAGDPNGAQYWGGKYWNGADPDPLATARAVAIAHRIYDCNDSFPGPTPPDPSPTPYEGITATPTLPATQTRTPTPTRTSTPTPTVNTHP